MDAYPQRVLTVSELTVLIRDHIEQTFPDIWLEGETSNLRSPSSGHLYFTLKDQASQIRAVLFRSQAQRLRFALKEGLQVVVRGRLTVYEPRGEYQIVLDTLEPKGLGALQLAFEQLKERLAREGLFDESRKRPLPFLPRRVGVVTSPSGAAIRDILAVLGRRCPIVHVLICPVPVQGDGAAEEIAAGIHTLSRSGKVDAIIVGRGGGSLEDLWSFNEEVVVRAIVESRVPVVSAVGHEIDYTLADFAADYRAPTPSAAAEAVAPVLDELVRTLEHLSVRLQQAIEVKLKLERHEADRHAASLPGLRMRIQRRAQRLDELTGLFVFRLTQAIADGQRQAMACRHELGGYSPVARVRGAWVLVSQLVKRAEQGMLSLVVLKRQAVRAFAGALDGLSPLGVLARGYSIIQTVPDGQVLRRAGEASVGDEVRARLAEGQLLCTVRKVLLDTR
jgi:exodeoxyribonuclease VII large subunit